MSIKPRVQKVTFALLLFGMGLGSGVWLKDVPQATHAESVPTDRSTKTTEVETEAPADITNTNFIAKVVNEVGPAVVSIDATKVVEASGFSSSENPSFNDPLFRRFFGDLPQENREYRQQGKGSGFITSEDGKIVTNAHVVEGADEVTVTLKDGRTFPGQVLGADPLTDIALIKIDAKDLPTVALGDSDAVNVGDWSIAIGNPLGLDSTVTAGIISAVGRSPSEVGINDKRVRFLQTDTAINPGNSGGPLLDASGKVIGVNTAILKGANGLGFAVPINTAANIARQLEASGKVEHTYLGIEMVALSPTLQAQINNDPNSGYYLEQDEGILVRNVAPDSPAARAGLRAGDVITHIGDDKIVTAEQVQEEVFTSAVGQTLDLKVDRNGQNQELEVVTGAYPSGQS